VGHLRSQGEVLPVERSVAFWVERDGCSPTAQETQEPDTAPKDGTRVLKKTYTGGRDGSEVVLYKIEGGGHTWPGGNGGQLRLMLGKVSHDINATKIIWQFFKNHSR
jgi:polyhydroxybutyrate depolymerase